MPTCAICHGLKPLDMMTKNNRTANGRGSYCKACVATKRRSEYTYANGRSTHLKFKYGLSLDAYENMLRAQNGVCAICHDPPSVRVTGRYKKPFSQLYVDHDAKTGTVRALLCNGCNAAIGHLRERPDIARRVVAYLEKHA